jgi:glutathione S-transferase
MNVTLYEMEHSPFCIPIGRALEALSVPFERVEVPNWDRSKIIEVTGGKYYEVPVLEHDGQVIYEQDEESQEVALYVDRVFGGGRLFPGIATGYQEILIHYLEESVELDGFRLVDPKYLDDLQDESARLMVIRHKERKFGKGCVDQWRREEGELRKRFDRHLMRFDSILESLKFLLGDEPVYADFLLFGILGNFTYRGYNRIEPSFPSLERWFQSMATFRFSNVE